MPAAGPRILTRLFGCTGTALLLICALPAFAAPPGGWFGMRLNFDTDGRANPTVKSLRVDDVFPESPAARARIAKDDEVVTVEGHTVAGAKAQEITALLHKAVGESVHLQLKHAGGEPYEVVLTAVALPYSRSGEPPPTTEGERRQ